jgi:hypothetical protein
MAQFRIPVKASLIMSGVLPVGTGEDAGRSIAKLPT